MKNERKNKKILKKLTIIFSIMAINIATFAGTSGAVTLKSADIKMEETVEN